MALGYLPVQLSHVFLHTVLSDEEPDNKVLLSSYLNYISAGDARNIRKAINSMDTDDDDGGGTPGSGGRDEW